MYITSIHENLLQESVGRRR